MADVIEGWTWLYIGPMAAKQALFRIFYRLGFTPWDGHPIADNLQALVEGKGELTAPAGKAVDLGCGTGDLVHLPCATRLAVTGVDYVSLRPSARLEPTGLPRSRASVRLRPRRRHASEPRRVSAQISQVIVDNGCLHNMSDGDRDAYVREVSTVAAPGARLLIVAFLPGGRFGVRGVEPAEMERRFTDAWTLLSCGSRTPTRRRANPARYYLYQRKTPETLG